MEGRSASVLIVEDQDLLRDYLELALGRMGFVVGVAACVPSAREMLDRNWDLVLSDYELPGGNGLQLLAKLAGDRPETRRVLMTGHCGILDDHDTLAAAGIEACLKKPFGLDQLSAVIARLLEPVGATV